MKLKRFMRQYVYQLKYTIWNTLSHRSRADRFRCFVCCFSFIVHSTQLTLLICSWFLELPPNVSWQPRLPTDWTCFWVINYEQARAKLSQRLPFWNYSIWSEKDVFMISSKTQNDRIVKLVDTLSRQTLTLTHFIASIFNLYLSLITTFFRLFFRNPLPNIT